MSLDGGPSNLQAVENEVSGGGANMMQGGVISQLIGMNIISSSYALSRVSRRLHKKLVL